MKTLTKCDREGGGFAFAFGIGFGLAWNSHALAFSSALMYASRDRRCIGSRSGREDRMTIHSNEEGIYSCEYNDYRSVSSL